MTERIKKLNELHSRVLESVEEHNFNCTIMTCPGSGKTIASFKVLYRLLDLGLIERNQIVVYNAETNTRKKVLLNEDVDSLGEIHKFKQLYNRDILQDFDFRFHCYQAKPDEIYRDFEDVALVINDEAHDALTAVRHSIITRSKARYNICLTGAMSLEANVFPQEDQSIIYQSQEEVDQKIIGEYVTKGQLLEMFCPVAIKYTTTEAISDGIISEFRTIKIVHELDQTKKYLEIWKTKGTIGTEYEFWKQKHSFAAGPRSYQKPAWLKRNINMVQLPQLLYDLRSKDAIVKGLLMRLKDEKTIVFGQRIETLQRMLGEELVVTPKNESTLVDAFNQGRVKVIGSSKLIKQGSNLNGVQNVIFHSYDSKWHNYMQKRARIRFLPDGQQAKLFFIVTEGTFESGWIRSTGKRRKGWFDSLQEEKDSKNKLIKKHDLNISHVVPSYKIIRWYHKNSPS